MLLLPSVFLAQWRGLQFERFDSRDGLNSDDIRAICQDSTGYLYFAGYQQLIRYDGHVFEDYTHDPDDSTSIGPGQISSMLAGSDGNIWLAMRRDGLNVLDPRTGTFARYRAPVQNNQIGVMIEDEHGDLWMGVGGYKLLKFDRTERSFTTFSGDPQEPVDRNLITVSGIAQDMENPDILWLTAFGFSLPEKSTMAGYRIIEFNRNTGIFKMHPCKGNVKIQDRSGRLLSGSWAEGFWRYDPRTQGCENLRFKIELPSGHQPGDGILDIYPIQSNYWLGSRSAIISITDDLTYTFVAKSDGLGSVEQFYEDTHQNIWVATDNGLLVMHPGDQHIAHYSLSAFGSVDRIYPGRLAYHKQEKAIYLINRNEPRIYRIPLDQQEIPGYVVTPERLYGIAVDPSGQIITATQGSLYQCNFKDKKLEKLPGPGLDAISIPWLWSLESNGHGIVAGIGDEGFYWMNTRTHAIRHLLRDDPFYVRVFFTAQGTAVISGGKKAHEIDLSSGTDQILHCPPNEHVIRDREGFYWVGTINHLGKYELHGDSLHLVRYYSAKDGLLNFTANHLHLDMRGRVWVFSNNGLSVIDPESEETRNIGVREGLVQGALDPVQVITLDDGRMCTVNGNGIIVFHPDSLWTTASNTNVHVVLKNIRITGNATDFGQNINTLPRIDLQSDQNTLDIQFQGLAFPTDRNIEYSYKVDGLHDAWNALGQNNTVTLSRLPPGSYVFNVKGGAPDSHAPVKQLAFSIATPFYLQSWFIALCGLLLVAAVIMTYRFRVRSIRRQEAEKTKIFKQMAELELQALRAQMNPHFMFNSLNSIKNYILRHESAKAAEYLSNFAHLIRMILQNSRETAVSLQDELETLLLYIDLEKLRFRDGFEFTCQIDDTIDTSAIRVPPMIVQPFLENAIWHGLLHKEDDRHLEIRVSQNNGSVLCEIDDNGIGREKALEIKSKSATRYKSMGMGITRDRIALLNSMNALGIEVDIIDKQNSAGVPEGTLVKIRIPNAHNSY